MNYDHFALLGTRPRHRELAALLDSMLAPLAQTPEALTAVDRIKKRSLSYAHKIVVSSFKVMENQYCESYLEEDVCRLFEADFQVLYYRTQPITLHFPRHPELCRYTPDAVKLGRDLKLTFVETKWSGKYNDPDIRRRYDLIKLEMTALGLGFEVMTEQTILDEPRHSFFKYFHRYAFEASELDVRTLLKWLGQVGDRQTIEQARAVLPEKANAAVIRAIYEGHIALELTSTRDGFITRRNAFDKS